MEYYFPDDIWKNIEDFLIHDIKKHGKHLKNDPYVIQYNKVIDQMMEEFYEEYFAWFF